VLEALDTDEPGDALHYSCLFSDDENLSQGLTAEIIRSQHLTERLEFLQVRGSQTVDAQQIVCRQIALLSSSQQPDTRSCPASTTRACCRLA
jgi:hypothetical protein